MCRKCSRRVLAGDLHECGKKVCSSCEKSLLEKDCKRENRECIFSSTRNKRAKVTHRDPIQNPQDEVERTDPDVSMHYYSSPLSGDGNQTESSDGKQTVLTLLDRQVYTSNDALEVLHE